MYSRSIVGWRAWWWFWHRGRRATRRRDRNVPGRRLLVQHAPLGHVLGPRRGIAVANELAVWSVRAALVGAAGAATIGAPVANAQARADRGRALPVETDADPLEAVGDWLATSNNATPVRRHLRKKAVVGVFPARYRGKVIWESAGWQVLWG
jgi:hypothetical protein